MTDFLTRLWDSLRHLDRLNEFVDYLGPWLYVVMFAIIFAETGLVVTPFLPGDSLLFALGAVAASEGSRLSLPLLAVLLTVAAILGDAVNYFIGAWLGPRVFAAESSRLLNKKHLLRAHEFYEKYGGKAIVLARFVPIVRTFAPFVAGIGRMSYWKFAVYNVVGGVVWVLMFLFAGYWFGKLPFIEKNFDRVILAIVAISVLPGVWEYLRARSARKRQLAAELTPSGSGVTDASGVDQNQA